MSYSHSFMRSPKLTKRQRKARDGKGAVPAHGGPGRAATRAAAHRDRLNNYGNPRGEGKLVRNKHGEYVDASKKGCFGGFARHVAKFAWLSKQVPLRRGPIKSRK